MTSARDRPPRITGEPSPRVRPERAGPHRVELILVGADLLRGHVQESSSRAIADVIAQRGDRLDRITIVGDDPETISAVLRDALDRNPHLVVTTGGLGPAADDCTLAAVAEVLGVPLSLAPQAKSLVEAAYQRLYKSRLVSKAGLNLTREKLCRVPLGGTPVANEQGVSPGVICRLPGGAHVLCLPGKPDEARQVFETAISHLRELAPRSYLARREIESPTADESSLRPALDRLSEEFPTVWISSRPVGTGKKHMRVLITVECGAPTFEEANTAVAGAVRRLLAIAAGSP